MKINKYALKWQDYYLILELILTGLWIKSVDEHF